MLIETIDSAFLDALDDEVAGFENVNLVDIINYLCNTYIHIGEDDSETNNITMMKTYNTAALFSPLAKQVENGRRCFATG